MTLALPLEPSLPAFRRALLLSVALLLVACATPHRPVPSGMEAWAGRLALRVDSDPPQSFSAGFDLRGTPAAGELQFTSPLGNTLVSLLWSPEGAEMRQGERVTRSASLDELTTALGGTPLPVEALFAWLRGEASHAPGWQADLSRHAEGRVTARRISPLPGAELRLVFQP